MWSVNQEVVDQIRKVKEKLSTTAKVPAKSVKEKERKTKKRRNMRNKFVEDEIQKKRYRQVTSGDMV